MDVREIRGLWASVIFAVACGVGVTLLFWHADGLRLQPNGTNVAWVALAAAGIGAMAGGSAVGRAGASLLIGSIAGVAMTAVSKLVFPGAPTAAAAVLGATVALLVVLAMASGYRLGIGPLIAGSGLGIAAANAAAFGSTTSAVDVLAVWTAVALATLLGLLAVQAVSTVTTSFLREAEEREVIGPARSSTVPAGTGSRRAR